MANYNLTQTGAEVQVILDRVAAGYIYMGVADLTTTPDTTNPDVYYLLTAVGTYTNFGNIAHASGIGIALWNGSAWSYQNVPSLAVVATDAAPTERSTNPVQSGGVVDFYGEYIENDDFVRIVTDKDGNILWGIKTDGQIVFGVGVPEEIKAYIDSNYETLSGRIDNLGEYIEYPDFVRVITDKDNNILFGIKNSGDVVFGVGIPQKIKDYVNAGDNALSAQIGNIQDEIDKEKTLKVTLDIANKTIKIQSELSANYDVENSMKWLDDNNYFLNPCLNYGGTYYINKSTGTRTLVNSETDAIGATSLSTGFIGANHGLDKRGIYANSNHGKDYSDIGSKWTYDSKIVVLVQVTESSLVFIPMYSENDGIYSYDNPPAGGTTLTHVSGATHTGSITLGARYTDGNSVQWKPSENIVERKFILDGKELTESGEYNGSVLDCIEIYDVYSPNSYLDKLISLAGTLTSNPLPRDYKEELGTLLRYTNDYRFTKGGCSVLINDWMTMQKVNFGLFFPVHTKIMESDAFGGGLQYYLPKALAKTIGSNTYDFRTPQSFVVSDNLQWTSADWENPNLPPDRAIEFVADNNSKRIAGLHYGYIFDQGVASGTNRKDYLSYWWIATTRAAYGGALNGGTTNVPYTMNPYTHYAIVSYRKYEDYTDNPNGVISISQFEVNGEYYVYADFNAQGTYTITIPTEWRGKKLTTFEKSDNVELLCGLSQSQMLVNVTTASPMYGYLVFAIHKNNI